MLLVFIYAFDNVYSIIQVKVYSPANPEDHMAPKKLAVYDTATASGSLAGNGHHAVPSRWGRREFPRLWPRCPDGNYSFLALPGSGPSPTATTPADRAMTELRASNHRAVEYALEDTRDQRHLQSLTRGLSAGVNQGPMGRQQVLSLIDAAAIPLRPLRREAQKTTTKAAAPVKTAYRPTPIPAYSPTKPWIVQ